MPQPFPVNRPAFMARRYMISAGHYLAASAGHLILSNGGNAIDAGVAGGLVINTVLPQWTGIGGVAPIVIYRARDKKVFSISGLGWWPKAASVELLKELGGGDMPGGVLRTVVPGAADAWLVALREFGTKTVAEVAAPAIELAERGFAVDPQLNTWLTETKSSLQKWPGTAAIFLPGGEVPAVGSVLRQPALAETLRAMCRAEATGSAREQGLEAVRDEFYRGEIARKMVEFNQAEGGLLDLSDLAEFSVEIEAPTTASYGEYEVHGCGFWCQGPVVQQALNVLEGYPLREIGHNTADYAHLVASALNLAFSDRHAFYGDPRFVDVPAERLLSKAYAAERRALIDMARAFPAMPPAGAPAELVGATPGAPWDHDPDTSYLCVVDEEGNGFSATPSDGMTTTPIVPSLGLSVSSRGRQSWLDDDHPAGIKPRKRPRLTPNPSIVTRNGELFMTFGTPGNDAQPQTMVQVFLNIVEHGMNPQRAVEAPRLCSQSFPRTAHPHPYSPARLDLEPGFDPAVWAELERRGHKVQTWEHDTDTGCGCCAIVVDRRNGILLGGADPRRDSYAVGW
jgi:gamma-glutamyltranspeptidase/glutathione hydrolase